MDWRSAEFPASQDRAKRVLRIHIIPAFGDYLLNDITPFIVEQWKTKRRQANAAPATIKKELDVLKAMLNKAVEWDVIDSHRISSVSAPKLLSSRPPPYYSQEQLQAIYAASIKHGALWRFMANTGMRRAEILHARRVDLVDGTIRIVSSDSDRTKSGKWRPVPLSPGALDALNDLGDDYLAPRMYPDSLSRAFRNDAKLAGLSGSIHWLRHTFCSHLVMSGIDLRTVQELAGHKIHATTLKYSHLSETHLQNAVSKLSI